MFESALLTKLKSDSILATYVTEFVIDGSSEPAIFAEFAPETAQLPYITFRITQSSDEVLAIRQFSIFVDYYDYNKSASNSRKAAERIEFVLDRSILEHDRFNCIRLFFFAGSPIQEEDPRSIHYNLQFQARAGRKKWINEIVTGTTTTTSGA
jgi:hypothetical protein